MHLSDCSDDYNFMELSFNSDISFKSLHFFRSVLSQLIVTPKHHLVQQHFLDAHSDVTLFLIVIYSPKVMLAKKADLQVDKSECGHLVNVVQHN